MKEIILHNGMIALVDDDDYEFVNQKTWRALKHKNTYYAYHSGVQYKHYKRLMYSMHRFIMGLDSEKQIDHIDGNGLNNQKNNLRYATIFQNAQNKTKTKSVNGKKTTSKYKGVYYDKRSKKWTSKITSNRKYVYIGCYDSEIKAAKAYNQYAKKLHGKFAKLNIISDEMRIK